MPNIVSWNIWCVPVIGGCPANHVRKVARFAHRLAQMADVVCFNECFTKNVRSEIMRSLPARWKSTPVRKRGMLGTVGSGVLVAWNSDVFEKDQRVHVMEFTQCCQLDCFAAKACVHVSLVHRESGRHFHILGAHLQSFEIPILCRGVREAQAAVVRDFRLKLCKRGNIHAEDDDAIVLAGDFNEDPSRRLSRILGMHHVRCADARHRTAFKGCVNMANAESCGVSIHCCL